MSPSERAWRHIRERHPELARYKNSVRNVAAKPEIVIKGVSGERKAIRWLARTHLGPKYLVVVYREERGEKAIITAYFTSDLKRVKGEVEWKV